MRRIGTWLGLLLLFIQGAGQAKPIHILVTGDMHGWLQPQQLQGQTLGGAAEMFAWWKRVEHLRPEEFLVLSAGDVATGPALSTVYKGLPAVEVMNAMGYDASALGNHEFDFGLEQLKVLQKAARFPFLAANVFEGEAGTGTLVPAYCVIERLGVKIGLIGLTPSSLMQLTGTRGYRVTDYADVVRQAAVKARADGAQVLLVLAHVPLNELRDLAAGTCDLGIPLMMGGHSHELAQAQEVKTGTWVVNSGEWWKAYSRIDLDFDPATGRTRVESSKQTWLQQAQAAADPVVKALVAKWQAKLDSDPAYAKPLGYLSTPLERFWPVSNFVCDAWLAMDPQADLVLNNDGSLRQDLLAGPLTRAELTGLLPFNNSMLRLRLTGKQLKTMLPHGPGLIGMAGLRRKGKAYVFSRTGQPLKAQATYKVLMNNYMYDTHPRLKAADPHPVTVFSDWRDPIEQWLLLHPSSLQEPLEKSLDLRPRL